MNDKPKEIKYDIADSGCWICTSHKTGYGRPAVSVKSDIGRREVPIFIILYEKKHGNIPMNRFLKHTCGVFECINPDHAELSLRDEFKNRPAPHSRIKYETTETGCHIPLNKGSYKDGSLWTKVPQFGKKKSQSVFRFLYQEKYGKILGDLILGHTCKNRECINIEHAELRTLYQHNIIIGPTRDIEYRIDENGCFICTSHSLHRNGYPSIAISGISQPISRVVLETKLGRQIKTNHVAMHKCDNPNCVNPDHIIEGTNQDNQKDAGDKGRHSKPQKLTWENIDYIREHKYDDKKEMAFKFHVTPETIHSVLIYKIWNRPTKESLKTPTSYTGQTGKIEIQQRVSG